jgi:hypothetical protein
MHTKMHDGSAVIIESIAIVFDDDMKAPKRMGLLTSHTYATTNDESTLFGGKIRQIVSPA